MATELSENGAGVGAGPGEIVGGSAHDASAAPVQPGPSREVVQARSATPVVHAEMSASQLVERLNKIKQAQREAMEPNVDYGVIPGTEKPTLYKPGAEKLGVLFELDVQTTNEKRWEADEHLTVISRATVYHVPTGARLGSGEGVCTTRERRYAKRLANRRCPECEAETILLSKQDDEGWFCWRKKGGCGARFERDDKRVTEQKQGEIDNPDLPELWNTAVKMANKRARVDAVLAVTGASAVFTQDVEDGGPAADDSAARFGATIDDASKERVRAALAHMLGEEANSAAVEAIWAQVAETCGGSFPLAAGHGIYLAASHAARKAREVRQDAAAEQPAGAAQVMDPATGEVAMRRPAEAKRAQQDAAADAPEVSALGAGMEAVTQGPEENPGAAPADPAARRALREAIARTGLDGETVGETAYFLYGQRFSDRLTEEQLADLTDLLEAVAVGGIGVGTFKDQLTEVSDREEREAARAQLRRWAVERANTALAEQPDDAEAAPASSEPTPETKPDGHEAR